MTVKILVIRGASLEKRELARTLRNGMTNAEKMLWTELRRRSCGGYSFRRQQVLLGFIVDFYCAEKKLIVELDGPIHDSQRAEDDARVRILSDAGFKIIRFKNTEVFIDIDKVVWQIRQKLDPYGSSPSYPSRRKLRKGGEEGPRWSRLPWPLLTSFLLTLLSLSSQAPKGR